MPRREESVRRSSVAARTLCSGYFPRRRCRPAAACAAAAALASTSNLQIIHYASARFPGPRGLSGVGFGDTLNTILEQVKKAEKLVKNKKLKEQEKKYPEQWFAQIRDHFARTPSDRKQKADDATSTSTWPQRFFENKDHFKPGGPVFLMIGGEGEISGDYVGDRFLADYLARTYSGSVLALEHRFYGQSQPNNGSLTDLSLLSSQQALADLAHFVQSIKKGKGAAAAVNKTAGEVEQQQELLLTTATKPTRTTTGAGRLSLSSSSSVKEISSAASSPAYSYADSKFICLGGSYPGNLAAWFRQKYPDVVHGCLSFSAPVYAKKDFYEYGQMVYHALGERTSAKLLAGYESILTELNAGTPDAEKQILHRLKACPFSVLSGGDEANVESILTGVSAGIVQYNNTLPEGRKIADVQKRVEEASTPEEAAWAVLDNFSELFSTVEASSETGKVDGQERDGSGLREKDDAKAPSTIHLKKVDDVDTLTNSTKTTIATARKQKKFHDVSVHDHHEQMERRTNGEEKDRPDCVDYSTRQEYADLVPDTAAAARSWVYQTCNEFGYFQTSRVSLVDKVDRRSTTFLKKSLYTAHVSDASLWDGICRSVFGIYDTETRIARTRAYYDVAEIPSRTVFVNGELDPWSTLSRPPNADGTSYLVPHGSHCVGLYGNPEDAGAVMPAARELQRTLVKTVGEWLQIEGENHDTLLGRNVLEEQESDDQQVAADAEVYSLYN